MSNEIPLPDDELLRRAATRRAFRAGFRKDLRPLNFREHIFVQQMLGPAKGDPAAAAAAAGFHVSGARVARRPAVRRALASGLRDVEARTGIEMDKDRLIRELDHAMVQANGAFRKTIKAHTTCPSCGKTFDVAVRAGPREIASLSVAQSRAVETAAKIVGALAPSEHKHQHTYQATGTYAEILRMVRDRPTMFTPAQLEQIKDAAAADRGDIESLLTLLPSAVTH